MSTFWHVADVLSTFAAYVGVAFVALLALDVLALGAVCLYRAHIADDWMDLADAVQDDDDFTAWTREMTA